MQFTTKCLIKGVSQREGRSKDGASITFHNVDLYSLDSGYSLDLRAGVNIKNGGAAVWEKAKKSVLQPVNVVLDVTAFNGVYRFSLVDVLPLPVAK